MDCDLLCELLSASGAGGWGTGPWCAGGRS